jgi:hypothetical protein
MEWTPDFGSFVTAKTQRAPRPSQRITQNILFASSLRPLRLCGSNDSAVRRTVRKGLAYQYRWLRPALRPHGRLPRPIDFNDRIQGIPPARQPRRLPPNPPLAAVISFVGHASRVPVGWAGEHNRPPTRLNRQEREERKDFLRCLCALSVLCGSKDVAVRRTVRKGLAYQYRWLRPAVRPHGRLPRPIDFNDRIQGIPPTRQPRRLPHNPPLAAVISFVGHASHVPVGWAGEHNRPPTRLNRQEREDRKDFFAMSLRSWRSLRFQRRRCQKNSPQRVGVSIPLAQTSPSTAWSSATAYRLQ